MEKIWKCEKKIMIENDSELIKYNKDWNKIKKTWGIKFHGMSVDDENYIKY